MNKFNSSSLNDNKTKNFFSKNAMMLVLLIVILFFHLAICLKNSDWQFNAAFFGDILNGGMLSPSNITNIIGQNGYVVILATGMLLCILTGGNIDLAVGSIVALVGAVTGILIVNLGLNPLLSILLCLISALLIGAWQAFWIAYIKVPPFITTLAGQMTFRGLALLIMGSRNIGPFPESFKFLFNEFILRNDNDKSAQITATLLIAAVLCAIMIGLQIASRIRKQRKGYAVESLVWMVVRLVLVNAVIVFVLWRLGMEKGIPVALIWLGVIVGIYTYFTQNTVPGRYLYAMGGNEKAARLSGINTKRMMFFAYTNMGFLSGIAALVCVARFDSASTLAGTGYELDAIASCFIGGASAYGGTGKISGAVIGAIFMGVLNMGMNLLGIDQNLKLVVKGLVLLAAVIFDVLSKNRKQGSEA